MPGRDKAGLDGSAWKHFNPLTAVAQRRETTTGVDARNRSTYSQVTAATKPEEKTIPKDFGVLTALQQAGEKSRDHFSKVLSRRRKMVKEEEGTMVKPNTIVGKADDKDNGTGDKLSDTKLGVGIDNGTAAKIFDKTLYHVLTTVAELELDSVHSKYRDIFSKNDLF